MAETEFAVAYDGPALTSGRMPVRDLAPALLALGDIFTEASLLLYPDRKPVALNIKATADGSFLVHLLVEAEKAWDQVIDIFTSDVAEALLNLKDYVIGGVGVFWLIKRLHGRRITAQEESVEAGFVRLTLDDGTTIELPSGVLLLYQSIEIRKRTREVVAPLEREGVEVVRFEHVATEVVIERADLVAFALPVDREVEEPLLDIEREMVVEITSVAFTEGNKWRLTDGQQTFFAAIDDEEFLHRVESGLEAFRKGDMLRCLMRIVQTRRVEGLQTEYRVVRVIEHIPRLTQLRLDTPPAGET